MYYQRIQTLVFWIYSYLKRWQWQQLNKISSYVNKRTSVFLLWSPSITPPSVNALLNNHHLVHCNRQLLYSLLWELTSRDIHILWFNRKIQLSYLCMISNSHLGCLTRGMTSWWNLPMTFAQRADMSGSCNSNVVKWRDCTKWKDYKHTRLLYLSV